MANDHSNWSAGEWPPDEIPGIQLSSNERANRKYRQKRERGNAVAKDIELPSKSASKSKAPTKLQAMKQAYAQYIKLGQSK